MYRVISVYIGLYRVIQGMEKRTEATIPLDRESLEPVQRRKEPCAANWGIDGMCSHALLYSGSEVPTKPSKPVIILTTGQNS